MTLANSVAIASLVTSTITAAAATYLSLVALRQSAKPCFAIGIINPSRLTPGLPASIRFRVTNHGYWYGTPAVSGITIYPNFPTAFTLKSVNYGAALQVKSNDVRAGHSESNYIKVRDIRLLSRGSSEDFVMNVKAPLVPGEYDIFVDAISTEGATFTLQAKLTVAA